MKLTIHPLTPARWAALENLFDQTGPVSRCWCMYWRIGSAYRKRNASENKSDFEEVVKTGLSPGLLAYEGDLVVGWCQLTPRDDLPYLAHNRRIEHVDDQPVWSLSCFYIRKDYRKKGVTIALIDAALDAARKAGAPALEAYPLDPNLTPSASSTGFVSTFKRAGFKVVSESVPARPVMRYEFKHTK